MGKIERRPKEIEQSEKLTELATKRFNVIEQKLDVIEQSVQMAGLATKEVLTFDEASQFTGLSKSYLYKLTSWKQVPHFKPTGKLCFFSRTELQVWLLQNRVSTIDEITSRALNFTMKKGGAK